MLKATINDHVKSRNVPDGKITKKSLRFSNAGAMYSAVRTVVLWKSQTTLLQQRFFPALFVISNQTP